MHPLLLLWDIDGTLIQSGGTGLEALRQTLLNHFGILDDLGDLEIAGCTDTSIAMSICRRHPGHGLNPEDFFEAYLQVLPQCLAAGKGRVAPGVHELLEWSHAHPEMHNALLTGNIRRGAEIKLSHHGLMPYFEFGAFGDDSSDRNLLGPIVLERARSWLKKDFHLGYTWVIGDTPRDIACGRALGCRVLAVATGGYSFQELQAARPDAVLSNLSKRDKVIALLEGPFGA